MEALDTQAMRLLRLFGNTTSKKVTPSVGAEQEYFLVDEDLYSVSSEKRPDLYRKAAVWRDASERSGDGRSLFRNDQTENRIVYERCKRRTLEGRRYGENSA